MQYFKGKKLAQLQLLFLLTETVFFVRSLWFLSHNQRQYGQERAVDAAANFVHQISEYLMDFQDLHLERNFTGIRESWNSLGWKRPKVPH